MRGARAFWITGSYAVAVSAFVLCLYAWLRSSLQGVDLALAAPTIGQNLWVWGCVAQSVLLCFFVPAFTTGAITLEREREMLELLFLTRLTALQICFGKLAAGVGFGLLLLLASLPPLALAIMLGSVTPLQVVQSVAILASSALFTGALGLCLSCMLPRTTTAATWAYLLLGFLLLGMPLILLHFSAGGNLFGGATDAGIAGMILACLAGTFPVAMLLGAFAMRQWVGWKERSSKADYSPPRVVWLLFCGSAWCVTALSLWLPGMHEVLQHGRYLLVMHPAVALLSVSPALDSLTPTSFASPMAAAAGGAPPAWLQWVSGWLTAASDAVLGLIREFASFGAWRLLFPHLWWLCSSFYLLLSGWLFLIAVLRVKRLRVG